MKIPLDTIDKISETISVLILLSGALIITFTIPTLPEIIPIHFKMNGEANGYGSKYMLWIIFGISVAHYIGLTFLSWHPEFYKSRMTKNNIGEQYKLTVKMTRTIKAVILLLFLVITFLMAQTAQLKMTKQIDYILPCFIPIIFSVVIYYTIKLGKVR